MSFILSDSKIGIIGLGYVGLPLAVEFGKKFATFGFDINSERIAELNQGQDSTLECSVAELAEATNLKYSSDLKDLEQCNVYIVTVPTPIDVHKQPDLTPLIKASEALGSVVKQGDVIIYESTVYPGATEEACIPVVEKFSGLKFNVDFFAGYSPERINPGDKEHRVTNILKVTSGSNAEVAEFVDDLYRSIITAGTHKASSIKVAEASKVIENVQRDVNIALINELHQVFDKIGINTKEVIEAASTKWNFMKLMPGLVGGHCIGVDPYYLLHKSSNMGYIPDLIRTAREINDSMPEYVARKFLANLIRKNVDFSNLIVTILGFTFKENCPDTRNTKVYNLIKCLEDYGINVKVYDPIANKDNVKEEYGVSLIDSKYEISKVCILTVRHDQILDDILDINFDYLYDYKNA